MIGKMGVKDIPNASNQYLKKIKYIIKNTKNTIWIEVGVEMILTNKVMNSNKLAAVLVWLLGELMIKLVELPM